MYLRQAKIREKSNDAAHTMIELNARAAMRHHLEPPRNDFIREGCFAGTGGPETRTGKVYKAVQVSVILAPVIQVLKPRLLWQ